MPKRATAKKAPPVPASGIAPASLGIKGFDKVHYISKSSFKDASMAVIVPTRTVEMVDEDTGDKSRQPMIHRTVVQAWNSLQWPMNAPRYMFMVGNGEVGNSYDDTVAMVVEHPDLKKWKYVLLMEDDNVPPPDGVTSLLDAIDQGPFDAVGGLYFTKGEVQMPQCYGDPYEYAQSGILEFRPRDVSEAVHTGGILPCNGIANGFSLFRMDVFKRLPRPWFKTGPGNTQDLYLCGNMKRAGMSLAVDCRCRVGHLDLNSGEMY